jgi:endonuclease/exonuclease/phosphatase family metal-dependent hydrolase
MPPFACAVTLLLCAGGCAGALDANTPAREEGSARLRVLTYNIHHGEGVDRKLDLERVAQVIVAQKPDLVALQEVDVKTQRTGGVDQAAELAKLTGMHVAFGRTIDHQGGQYGNAVLSRFPIESSETHPLPGAPSAERRGALAVAVRPWARGPAVTFVATHFDHQIEPDRVRQAEEINRLFAGDDEQVTLLAGDFNAEPASAPIQLLTTRWADAAASAPDSATSPATKPRRRIDYVMLRPAGGWRVIGTTVVNEPLASDHRPVLAVVEWQGARRP